MIYIINEENDGMLLRNFIKLQGVSSKLTAKLKRRENGIMQNGKRVTVRAVLHTGDAVELNYEDTEEDENANLCAVKSELNIIFEDEYIIAVNKPGDMPTHQSFGHYEDAMSNALAAYFRNQNRAFVFRAVNRLDLGTSGIVLVAKDRLSASKLSAQVQNGLIEKTYITCLDGEIPGEHGTVEGYIRRKGKSIITREVCTQTDGAEYAKTVWHKIESGNGHSLIEAKPITGRTHQLRVHFSSIGYPITGDPMYGIPCEIIGRQALHAKSLEFSHPITGTRIRLEAPLPKDIKTVISRNFTRQV